MTTITKEWLQQTIAEFENTRDDIPFGLSDDDAKVLIVLKRALASLEAEPAGYHVIKECGKVGCSVATLEEAEKTRDFWNKKWTIRPYFYTAQPVQETDVYNDVLNIISLLENNEWAEHCTSTVLGSLLESEITRLVGKEQSAPVVTFYRDGVEAAAKWIDQQREAYDSEHGWSDPDTGAFEFGNDAQRGYSSTLEELAEGIRALHPNAGNSPVIPDGWISCSERMPEDEQEVIVHNKLGYRYVSYFDEHSGLFFDMRGGNQMNCIEHIFVTHWMPVPAAPKPEINNE